MTHVVFVALAFGMTDNGLAPRRVRRLFSGDAAIKLAETLSHKLGNTGAIAFVQQGKTTIGPFEDAVLLHTFGEVPADLSPFFNAKAAWDARPVPERR